MQPIGTSPVRPEAQLPVGFPRLDRIGRPTAFPQALRRLLRVTVNEAIVHIQDATGTARDLAARAIRRVVARPGARS
jgi:hypothetical protein